MGRTWGCLLASTATFAGGIFPSFIPAFGGMSVTLDWPLGILFGVGGFIGKYFGTRAKKFVPQRVIKMIVSSVIVFLTIKYIVQYC